MKAKKILYYFLMFLPLLVTLIAIYYLPEQIPAHYDFNNEVTRWGSKYETLIFPAITIISGIIMLVVAKYSGKQEENVENNEKICITTGILTLLLFNAMTYYFLYTDFNKIENLSTVPISITQITFGLLGILMIVSGSIMPKLHMNAIIGLRTSWSQKNETTWEKSQKFGGLSFIIAGIAIIAICLFTKEFTCFALSMVVYAVLIAIDVYYTYKIAQKY